MAIPRFAWGIDIGNRALKAVKLVRDGDALRVDDFEFIEHETILSQAGDNRESIIQAALGNLVQRHNFKGGVVAIGVSGQNSFARFVKLPPVEDRKIPEIVRFEAIQQIPFPLDDVEWSYQLFRQEDNPEVEVGIFAMRKELVNQHIKHFTDFDLNVQNVQMNPLAVYNALQYDGRFNDGLAMVVDVGTDNTDLIIADNTSIWMRSIPIGGSNFTEALVKAFKLNFVKAEDLKRNAATSKYARQIFQHMRPVFADLVAEIQRSIGFYSSVHRDAKIGKIYALGGTFKLPGLQKYLQQNLQLPVERLDSLAAGAPSDPKHAATFGDNLLSIVGPYGLAVQAMGGATVTSSLLPRAIQRERMWQEKTKWFGLAAALFIAGTTVVGARYFLADLQYKNGSAVREQNQKTLKVAEELSRSWDDVQNAGDAERTIIANLQTMVEGKYLWRDLETDIINAMPRAPEPLRTALLRGDVEGIKRVPRAERQIVQIDEIIPSYDPKMVATIKSALANNPNWKPGTTTIAGQDPSMMPQPDSGTGEPAPAPAGGEPMAGKGRGFIIRMRITTPLNPDVAAAGRGVPYAAAFVDKAVQDALLSIAPTRDRPNIKYAVRNFWVLQYVQLFNNAPRMARLQADYDAAMRARGKVGGAPGAAPPPPPAGGGFGGFGGPGGGGGFGGFQGGNQPPATAAPAGAGNNPAFQDRLTGESMLNDFEFEIAIAVELDPDPWQKPAPVDATAAAK